MREFPVVFCDNIPFYGSLCHVCFPNLMKFQVPYISVYLCAEKLRLNYLQGMGNIFLSQFCELRHEVAFHKGQL